MPPKTAAERMRKYRARMNDEKKQLVKERNREQQKCSRKKWDGKRKKLEAEKSKQRVRKYRQSAVNRKPSPSKTSPSKAFGSIQSFGKAIRKANSALPSSPRKKVAVVKKLAQRFGIRVKLSNSQPINIPKALETTIQNFYASDSISRQLPGRKDYVTINKNGKKEKVQKKILMTTVMEAFKQFKNENPDVKIGKSKFASLRPPNVLPVSEKDHNVCCCSYHENFEMLLDGLRRLQVTLPNLDEVIALSVCGSNVKCHLGECSACDDADHLQNQLIDNELDPSMCCPYLQWVDNQKITINATLGTATSEMLKQLKIMRRHVFIAKIQLGQIRRLKEKLQEGEGVLQEDFSENFQIKQQDEIMSAHWVTNGVTIFTAVLNTTTGVKSYAVVSDELHHDKFSVVAFNRAILKHASLDSTITKLHVFTDGAGSQFKNRYTLSNLVKPWVISDGLTEVDWSFFATAHGKGPVDGVGGSVKRTVWRRILQKRVFLNTPKEFATVAKEACPNINVLYVSSEEVSEVRDELEQMWVSDKPQGISDIRSYHYFKPISPYEIEVSAISPFMPDLETESTKVVIFKNVACQDETQHVSSISATGTVDKIIGTDPIVNIELEKYYAVDYVEKFYIGRILGKGKTNFWHIKFLHQISKNSEPTFNWPKSDDCEEVHESVVFYGPVTLIGFSVDFRVENIKNIQSVFAQLKAKK